MIHTIEKILRRPFDEFFKTESASGVLLFFVTIAALIWANSPWGEVYKALWNQPIVVGAPGILELEKPLIIWINDGLMAVFFFLIGLEIKRELMVGELNDLRKASLPLIAALGGILVPVTLFLLLNDDPYTRAGWGIPMATDIAFSLAVLNVLGKRVPLGLKVFLTAFAIVDDLGAVVVIAVFYSSDLQLKLLGFAAVLLALAFFLSNRRIYSRYVYFSIGTLVWVLFLKSGVHPTIAGVLMAFTIPMHRKANLKQLLLSMQQAMHDLQPDEDERAAGVKLLSHRQISILNDLMKMASAAQSPLQALEHRLHGWVAYLILPIFALANAGVDLTAETQYLALSVHIAIALVAGKFLGIFTFTWAGLKLKLCDLPSGVNLQHVAGVGLLAGIGFTMAMFISNLAFDDLALVNASKLGILGGSLFSGIAGYVLLRLTLLDPKADD